MADTTAFEKNAEIFFLCVLSIASFGAVGYQNSDIKKKNRFFGSGLFLCLIFQLEKCLQNHGDDGADDEADYADTLKTEIHGE